MKSTINRSLLFGLIITGIMIAVTLGGVFWTPYIPTAMDFGKFQPPSLSHLFGTDNFGRDIFSRVLKGAGTTLTIALSTVSIGALVGTFVGGGEAHKELWVKVLNRSLEGRRNGMVRFVDNNVVKVSGGVL